MASQEYSKKAKETQSIKTAERREKDAKIMQSAPQTALTGQQASGWIRTEDAALLTSNKGQLKPKMDTSNMVRPADALQFGENNTLGDRTLQDLKPAAVEKWNSQFSVVSGMKVRRSDDHAYVQLTGDEADLNKYADNEIEIDIDVNAVSEEELAKAWEGKIEGMAPGQLPGQMDVALFQQKYITETLEKQGIDREQLNATYYKGGDTGRTIAFFKQHGMWDTMKLCMQTIKYRNFTDMWVEDFVKEQEKTRIPKTQGTTSIPPETQDGEYSYEEQDIENCYGCSLSCLYNRITRDEEGAEKLDQYKVRKFEPRYLTSKEMEKETGLPIDDEEEYERTMVDHIKQFAGAGKTRAGNIIAISDVIFDKKENGGMARKDIAAHKCVFELKRPEMTPVQRHNTIEYMKQQIHEALKTGQPVGILHHGHYQTIVGLSGDKVTYLDSIFTKDARKPETKDFLLFLKGGEKYGSVDTTELTWLQKIDEDSYDELQREYGTFIKDPVTGEVKRTDGSIAEDEAAHRVGVVVKKERSRIIRKFPGASNFISEQLAVHRKAFVHEEEQPAGEQQVPQEQVQQEQVPQEQQVKETEEKKEEVKTEEKKEEVKVEEKKEEVKAEEKKEEVKTEEKKEEAKVEEKKEEVKVEAKKEEVKTEDKKVETKAEGKKVETKAEEKKEEKKAHPVFSHKAKEINDDVLYEWEMTENFRLSNVSRVCYSTNEFLLKKFKLPKADTVYGFAKANKENKDKTIVDRENAMGNPSSRLYAKRKIARDLETNSAGTQELYAKRRMGLPEETKALVSEEDLEALSAFFTDNKEQNARLVRDYARKADKDKESDGRFYVRALDSLTSELLKTQLDDLDLTDDASLVRNSKRLEDIACKVKAFFKFYNEAPEYERRLKDKYPKRDMPNIANILSEHVNQLSAVADYYRTRKMLLTNSYYLSHYNDEIAPAYKDSDPEEVKEVSRLILMNGAKAQVLARAVEDRLPENDKQVRKLRDADVRQSSLSEKKNYSDWAGYYMAKQDELSNWSRGTGSYSRLDQEDYENMILQMEAQHKKRAFSTGRIDKKVFTKEKYESFLGELTAFKLDHPTMDKKAKEALKKASPAVRGLYEARNILNKKRKNDAVYDVTDPQTKTTYRPGIDSVRDWDFIKEMAMESSMSKKEAEEFVDKGLRIPRDAVASKKAVTPEKLDIYLKSLARYYGMLLTHMQRYHKTYGFIPNQVPEGMIFAGMSEGGAAEFARRTAVGAAVRDMLESTCETDGVTTPLLDVLVQKGYMKEEDAGQFRSEGELFVKESEARRKGINVLAGTVAGEETEGIEPLRSEDYETINSYRGRTAYEKLSEEEEMKAWAELTDARDEADITFMAQEKAAFAGMKAKKGINASLSEYYRFKNALKAVDTSGHSKKYTTFTDKLDRLMNEIERLSGTRTKGKKLLDPDDVAMLAAMCQDVRGSVSDYLKGKNFEHKNEKYRKRYQIAVGIRDQLLSDSGALYDQAGELREEHKRLAEEERAEEKRKEAERLQKLEEERLAEEKRLEEERNAEEKRLEEERIAEEKRKEEERIAKEKERKERDAKNHKDAAEAVAALMKAVQEEDAKRREEERIAEEKRKEEERLAKEKERKERDAKNHKDAAEAAAALMKAVQEEDAKRREEERIAEEKRKEEERLAEEKRKKEEEERKEEERRQKEDAEEKAQDEELSSQIKEIESLVSEAEKPHPEKEQTEEERREEEAKLIELALKKGEGLDDAEIERKRKMDKLDGDKDLQKQLSSAVKDTNAQYKQFKDKNSIRSQQVMVKEQVQAYGKQMLENVASAFAELSETQKLYVIWLEQKGTVNEAYETRIETLQREVQYAWKTMRGWTDSKVRALRNSIEFKSLPVVRHIDKMVDNLQQQWKEDTEYVRQVKIAVSEEVKAKKKEIEDLYSDVPFAKEEEQDQETKKQFEELMDIIKAHPMEIDKTKRIDIINAKRKRVYYEIQCDTKELRNKLNIEKLTAKQFEQLRKADMITAHSLYTKYRMEHDEGIEKRPELTDLGTGSMEVKLDFGTTDPAVKSKEKQNLWITSVDKEKDEEGAEKNSYTVEWSKEGHKEPMVFRMKRDPREMSLYSNEKKSIRQSGKNNANAYGAVCTASSGAMIINQILGKQISNANINEYFMMQLFPEFFEKKQYSFPDRDKYGNIVKEKGKRANYSRRGGTLPAVGSMLPYLYGLECIVSDNLMEDVNDDRELDPQTGLDIRLNQYAQALDDGAVLQININDDMFYGRPVDQVLTPWKGEVSRRFPTNHSICLCGACYDQKDGHLAGFFYKDTGADNVQFISAERLSTAIRGIKKEKPEDSMGAETFSYMLMSKPESFGKHVDAMRKRGKRRKLVAEHQEKPAEETVIQTKVAGETITREEEEPKEEFWQNKVTGTIVEKPKEMEIPTGVSAALKMTGMETAYAEQYDNDCYCVAGVTLYNQLFAKWKGWTDVKRNLPHSNMRSYKPVYKKYDPKYEKLSPVAKAIYQGEVSEIKSYTARGSEMPGNIFKLADYYLDKAEQSTNEGKDLIVRNLQFFVPSRDGSEISKIKTNNRKAIFMKQVKEVIDKGGVVALMKANYAGSHYVTITEINDQEVTVYDSLDYDSYKHSTTIKIDDLFKPNMMIELTWLEDLPSPQELTKEFSNLTYDEEKGYALKEDTMDEFLQVAHTKGIDVCKMPKDLTEEYDSEIRIRAYFRNPKVKVETSANGEV